MIIAGEINLEKIRSDLKFIQTFTDFTNHYEWRLVIYGGYGLDGYLQQITRNHGDIDLVIYGQSIRSVALTRITQHLKGVLQEISIDSKDEEFFIDIKVKSKDIVGNFYYVQTTRSPYQNLNIVVKRDGDHITNSPTDFPSPVAGRLGDMNVEVQDQSAHLGDILRKRSDAKSLSKHDQDIKNINLKIAS